MKTIKLTQGFDALVDDADYEELSKYKWCAKKDRSGQVYAHRARWLNGKANTITMHRQILNGPDRGDHIDGNGLNNQRSNLRPATQKQNAGNRVHTNRNNTSGVPGVYWRKSRSRWEAVIARRVIGLFKTLEGAKVARRLAEIATWGEFAPKRDT